MVLNRVLVQVVMSTKVQKVLQQAVDHQSRKVPTAIGTAPTDFRRCATISIATGTR
jgi:hypothetical protein